MTNIDPPSTVYVCHPITTGDRSVADNIKRIEALVAKIYSAGDIPLSPYHMLKPVCSTTGDQTDAYALSIRIMSRADHVLISDDFFTSKGCRLEYEVALNMRKPIIRESVYQ